MELGGLRVAHPTLRKTVLHAGDAFGEALVALVEGLVAVHVGLPDVC